jgi:dipeptidyl aminopeptidase/acylaminoacyl peptidase
LTLLEQNPGDVDGWLVDVHGVLRGAAAQVKGGLTEVRIRDGATGPFRVLGQWKDEDNATPYAFTKEGDALYFGTAQKSNTRRLVKLGLKDASETVIFEDTKYDVGGPIISDKTNELEGVSVQRERAEYVVYSEALKKDLANLARVHEGDINLVSEDREEQKLIVSFDSPSDPGATYLYDRSTGQAKFLYRPRPWLKPESLVSMYPIQYAARDGLMIDGYLSLPKGRGLKNLPLVMVVHGGPWARDDWGYNAEAQFLANRGYAVLQVNYRSSTGYGKKFLHAGDREWGNKMLFDLIDGVNWAVGQGIADPKRLAIYGGSYGGYATLSAVAFQPGVFAAGISYVGPSNLLTLFASIPPYWQTFREIMYQRVGNPDTEPDFLKSRSPLFSADKINVPLFIAQGNNDPRVKTAESDQIVNALKAKGKPVEYLLKMDEGHGFQNPENRMEFYGRMEDFLAKNLK